MIGLIPSGNKTYEVIGAFDNAPIENKLYYNPIDNRIYIYNNEYKRPTAELGYFPIWNGIDTIDSKFALIKFYPQDVLSTDLNILSSTVTKDIANRIMYDQRRSVNDVLVFEISDEDNMFTQCIKGSINAMNITMPDLFEMSQPHLMEKIVVNYCSSLAKIAFMRIDRWNMWIDMILHLSYEIEVYDHDKCILKYKYPSNEITSELKYDKINDQDPLKRIVKILIEGYNISKSKLKVKNTDDYTINNLFTALNNNNYLSSQLFGRFIKLNDFNYSIKLFDKEKLLFEYKE